VTINRGGGGDGRVRWLRNSKSVICDYSNKLIEVQAYLHRRAS
jgi:hypothetical protein